MIPCLKISNLYYGYENHPFLLKGIDLNLYPQDRLGIKGCNGSGKSTLFSLILGLKSAHKGQIFYENHLCQNSKDFQYIRTHIGLLFQNSDHQLFCPTVLDEIIFGPLNLGLKKQQAHQRALEAMKFLNIEHLSDHISYHLSGGEKKLVALASILSMSPQILLLDEPTAGLDLQTRDFLIHQLKRLPQAMIITSHDDNFLKQITHRNITLHQGSVI